MGAKEIDFGEETPGASLEVAKKSPEVAETSVELPEMSEADTEDFFGAQLDQMAGEAQTEVATFQEETPAEMAGAAERIGGEPDAEAQTEASALAEQATDAAATFEASLDDAKKESAEISPERDAMNKAAAEYLKLKKEAIALQRAEDEKFQEAVKKIKESPDLRQERRQKYEKDMEGLWGKEWRSSPGLEQNPPADTLALDDPEYKKIAGQRKDTENRWFESDQKLSQAAKAAGFEYAGRTPEGALQFRKKSGIETGEDFIISE